MKDTPDTVPVLPEEDDLQEVSCSVERLDQLVDETMEEQQEDQPVTDEDEEENRLLAAQPTSK